jgi:hypothetical protein
VGATPEVNRVHAFLRNAGPDGRGRSVAEVLRFDDRRIETEHDFVQWLFPLREASRAVPGSPVLEAGEAALIRADPVARAALRAALARMTRFYLETDRWLTAFDHNHLRITRIIAAMRDLLGQEEASGFHDMIIRRNIAAGAPVNSESLRHWERALGEIASNGGV